MDDGQDDIKRDDREARDLRDLMREERSRGRRPVDMAEVRENEERAQQVKEILKNGNEEDLRELLEEWEYSAAEIEEIVVTFRAARGQR